MEWALWQQTSDSGEDIDSLRGESDIDSLHGESNIDSLHGESNIDSLRGEFESSKEWKLRKKFLEMNYGSLPVDRLVCLSRCFVNIAMYGCSYPAGVIKDIRERSGGILEEFHVVKNIKAKQRYTDSFVKASSGSASRGSLGISTAGLKKLRTADTRASHRTRTHGGSRVVHTGHDAFKKAVTPAASTSMALDDYDYWDGQEDVTDDISFEESMDKSTVPAVNTNSDLWNQDTHFVDSEPHSQHLETVLSKEEYFIAYQKEASPVLRKIRKFAFEVLQLKSQLNQTTRQVIHSAGQCVPVAIAFNVEKVCNKRPVKYSCQILIERIEVASETGPSKNKAKTNVCEAALKVIMMPRLEIIQTGDKHPVLKGTSSLQDRNMCQILPAQYDTTQASSSRSYKQELSDKAVSYNKETNVKKVRSNQHEFKALEDFIILEKMNSSSRNAFKILKQSVHFNKVLMEYDFYPDEMATRCVVKIEGEVVADVLGSSKSEAKKTASGECLRFLRSCCWVLKTKQAVDSSTTISKEEIEEARLNSNQISSDNIGCRMLQKMGWSGGGVGKYGTGILEPITVVNVLNRQGLGLNAARGVSDGYRQRIKEVIKNYVASGGLEDLVFSFKFSNDEEKIIRNECRKLGLQCVSRGKKNKRILCVSRKLSANELFEHIMACGGETAKYKLFPPGTEATEKEAILPHQNDTTKACFAKSSKKKKVKGKGIRHCKQTLNKHLKREQCGDKKIEDLVIVLPWHPSAGGVVSILKQNAVLNRVILEYDFFIEKEFTQCVVKIEGEVVADVVDSSKKAARRKASAECLRFLRKRCWVLQTKQAANSTISASKERIQKGIQLKSNQIGNDTSDTIVEKNGTEISEPASMESDINRLTATSGNSDDFNQLLAECIENYATSGSAEDLMFSSEFNNKERKLILEKCRQLKLQCVSRGKGPKKYLCVSNKLSASQLFEYVKACGGETAKYKILPPGTDAAENEEILSPQNNTTKVSFAKSSVKKKLKGQGIRNCKKKNNKRVKKEQRGDKTIEDFVIVIPWHPSTAGVVKILKRSAFLNGMHLKYDFFIEKESTQCVLKIEGEVVADVVDSSKKAARRKAAAECLRSLRKRCWVLQTKQAANSSTSVSIEEIQRWAQLKSNQIGNDTSDTIVGKNGTEISEPASMESDINRLTATSGNSDDFNQLLEEFIENYATSGSPEDLIFSSEFSNKERKLIREKCQKLELHSVRKGQCQDRYLRVSKKLSASQLVEHVKACGGETAIYKLLPPGTDVADEDDQLVQGGDIAE
ncbi:hypothetical protein BsWGS_08995 [Bradybaena similaris]